MISWILFLNLIFVAFGKISFKSTLPTHFPSPNTPKWLAIKREIVTPTDSEKELKSCLYHALSEDDDDPYVPFILGNLYLFGYSRLVLKNILLVDESNTLNPHYNLTSVNCDPSYLNKSEDSTLTFTRNMSLAYKYFTKSHKDGHPNAAPFIFILIKYSKLFNFNFSRTKLEEQDWYLSKIMVESSNLNSFLSKQIMISELLTCGELDSEEYDIMKKIEDLIYDDNNKINFENLFYSSFQEHNCWKCEEAVVMGIEIASKALEFLQKNGGEGIPPNKFENHGIAGKKKGSTHQQNLSEALVFIKQMADLGATFSQRAYGELSLFGDPNSGVEQNHAQAIQYLEMAANNGDPNALHTLGLMNIQGLGMKSNFTKGKQYFEKSIEKGFNRSYGGLAFIYINGMGVDVNISKAAKYLEYAVQTGDGEALANLAALYHRGGEDFPKNVTKAFELFLKSARDKQPSSMFNLALISVTDPDVVQNVTCKEILGMIQNIITRTDIFSLSKKAFAFYDAQDYNSAFFYSLLAANIGIEKSYSDILFLVKNAKIPFQCMNGDDLYCELIFAYQLSQFHIEKSNILGNLIYQGSPTFRNDSNLSIHYYKKGAAKNDPESHYSLAYMYEIGDGFNQNYTNAYFHYNQIINLAYSNKIKFEHFWPASFSKIKLMFKEITFNFIEKLDL